MSVSLNSRLVSRVLCVRQCLQCRHPLKPLVQLSRSLTQPHVRVGQSADQHQAEPKPFSEIPAAKGWPLLGTFMDYGKPDTLNKAYRVIQQRVKKLGWIYREKLFSTFPEMLVVVDPDDVQTVFRADGKWPSRMTLDVWVESERHSNVPPGIFMLEKEEWYKQRQPMGHFMLKPKKVAEYHEGFNEVTQDLLKLIRHQRDPQSYVVADVARPLFKWSFESISLFTLGKRLGCLDVGGAPKECQEYVNHVQNLFLATQKLSMSIPLYKIYPTQSWKLLLESQRRMYEISMRHVEEKMKDIKEHDSGDTEPSDGEDFISYMLHKGQMSLEEVTANATDLLSAGVDTTSYTLAWTLYNLATHPQAQERLRSEVLAVVGSEEVVTPTHINNMSYLRNCIKESLRLYPLFSNNSRILSEDLILSGYKVPAGTSVLMPLVVQGRLPELFPEPDLFKPERWDRDNHVAHSSMFASLPFSHGPRMCIGRRVAELELHIALSHLIRNFEMEYLDNSPMGYIQKFLLIPEKPIDLSMKDI